MSFIGRLLFPAVFRQADKADQYKARAAFLEMELDWAHVVDQAERLGIPVPVVRTVGQLKALLPPGILVVEEPHAIIRLAFAAELKKEEGVREVRKADAAFLEAAVSLVQQAVFVGLDDPEEYRFALSSLVEAYKVRETILKENP